jgi:hypothetical protein
MKIYKKEIKSDIIHFFNKTIGKQLITIGGGKYCTFNKYNEKEFLFHDGAIIVYFNNLNSCLNIQPVLLFDQDLQSTYETSLQLLIEESPYDISYDDLTEISRKKIEIDFDEKRFRLCLNDFIVESIEVYGFDDIITNNADFTFRVIKNDCILFKSENGQRLIICDFEMGNIPTVKIQMDNWEELLESFKKVGYNCKLKLPAGAHVGSLSALH